MELSLLQHPNFGEIRTAYDENGTVMFCAVDVAKALGYARPSNAVTNHCTSTLKKGTEIYGQIRMINYIYEPDVYRLVAKSNLPLAVEFERWIFEEVLPSLRKTGFYAKKDLVQNPDLLIAPQGILSCLRQFTSNWVWN